MARTSSTARPASGYKAGVAAITVGLMLCGACSRDRKENPAPDEPPATPTNSRADEDRGETVAAPTKTYTLLVAQAHFEERGEEMVPGPAKLVLLHADGDRWSAETLLDPDSNVFHKAVVWRDGILTIGGMGAILRHWKRGEAGWKATTLWQKSWGGKIDRLRDLELGDVNADGKEEIVLATHDQGVVAVGSDTSAGWEFVELGRQEDTFVHEIELGDVDGDGKIEIYCTPSDRNRASGLRQAGSVVRYAWDGKTYVRSVAAEWKKSHAKEILVADVDGDGADELYAVREAELGKNHRGERVIKAPVKIVRLDRKPGGGWIETTVATIDDRGTRFLVSGDVDGDKSTDLVVASMHAGLWVLRRNRDGSFEKTLIDANSSGFEHAAHVADLDGDGVDEIYVASDDQGELRRYEWSVGRFTHRTLAPIPDRHITWNIQHGAL